MIRLFQSIRRRLLDEGSVARYLAYATGEILLVVIGILIALQINNWNEIRQSVADSRALLAEFRKDLESDVQGIDRVVALLERQTSTEADILRAVSYTETEQNDVLIRYAESIAGRNFVKQNYGRRSKMIETFGRVQAESRRLIARIDARLVSET